MNENLKKFFKDTETLMDVSVSIRNYLENPDDPNYKDSSAERAVDHLHCIEVSIDALRQRLGWQPKQSKSKFFNTP